MILSSTVNDKLAITFFRFVGKSRCELIEELHVYLNRLDRHKYMNCIY